MLCIFLEIQLRTTRPSFHVSRSETIQRGCNNGNKDEVNFRRFLYTLFLPEIVLLTRSLSGIRIKVLKNGFKVYNGRK